MTRANEVRYEEAERAWEEENRGGARQRRSEEGDVPIKPLGFSSPPPPSSPGALLARPASARASLGGWMPPPLRNTSVELLYSSDVHGRSLTALYGKCGGTRRTVTLIEVLDDNTGESGDGGGEDSSAKVIVGMFATHSWSPRPSVYGDGGCFLFRLSPDPVAYKWNPTMMVATAAETADDGGGSSFEQNLDEALAEQFQVCRPTHMSMGGNVDGTSGLRLDEYLERGQSAPALGFDNEPLVGTGGRRRPDAAMTKKREFEVGAVEVYRLLREVDGRPVDGEDDAVWNLGTATAFLKSR